MKSRYALLMPTLLTAFGFSSFACGHIAAQSDLRPGETMVVLPTEPHQWRKDADCYVSKNAFDPNNTAQPLATALRWRKRRHFSGYLFTTFEGWSFALGRRSENPKQMGEHTYYASVYYTGRKITIAPEPRIYWVNFVGREAMCNSQRPDDREIDVPFSPNLVIIDRLETVSRVRSGQADIRYRRKR